MRPAAASLGLVASLMKTETQRAAGQAQLATRCDRQMVAEQRRHNGGSEAPAVCRGSALNTVPRRRRTPTWRTPTRR